MFKIFTPHGIIETESFKEVQSYQAQGCTYEKILDEHSPESVFEKSEPKPYRITGEAFVIDPTGHGDICYSDADSGL